ncbi:glutamine synthetase [Colletotrichum truncatum]|uniref:Glutamine synthetase n=1 Tax=Colletotrichum truncatum TaxID=5467 RepID=A0ACC3Z079_COLTU|nr:glutamine synthetase [Colletotrichum truncatum]KAF6800738.1 glutamine synthetase [Colletotrichum truncatum]
MTSDEEKLQKFLDQNNLTSFIRLQWIDYSGVLRVRFVPVARCLEIARGNEQYLIPQVSMIIPISTAPRCFPTGNHLETWELRPDWSSLRCCGFRPSHASVMCFVEHKEAEDTHSKCPRALLSRALKQLEENWDTKALAGFEIECMLLDHNSQPLDQLDRLNSYQTTAGLRGQTLDIVEEIIDSLKRSSINIHHFHTETHDQIEFALSPEPLLDAIDSFVLAQETIRTVFVRHNIKATMAPKPLLNGPTNGTHLHMSVDKLETRHTDSFLAGILNHMGSLCAFGMANYDGYVRTTKDAAGEWVGFGTENRDLPVRNISEKHWEFRMMDSTSNPYLFAAAVLLSGLNGLGKNLVLDWEDCTVFPQSLDNGGRAEYRLVKRMPRSLQEALDLLKAESSGKPIVPKDLLDAYIPVKEKEVEEFLKMPDDQRRLRFLEYF